MISIVDADELRNVLRPTVYRPTSDEMQRGDGPPVRDGSIVKGDSAVKMPADRAMVR
jgi:hypothetical protein